MEPQDLIEHYFLAAVAQKLIFRLCIEDDRHLIQLLLQHQAGLVIYFMTLILEKITTF